MSVPMPSHVIQPVTNGPLRRRLRAAFKSWQRRKMMAFLYALDDRTLRDIGIHRSEIARAVDGLSGAGWPMAAPMPRGKVAQRYGGQNT